MTLLAPKSGEQLDQMAPMLAHAKTQRLFRECLAYKQRRDRLVSLQVFQCRSDRRRLLF